MTGRFNLTVSNFTVFFMRLDTRRIDALNTIRAFFHDTARTDGHIRIAHGLQAFGVNVRLLRVVHHLSVATAPEGRTSVIIKVEAAHFLRAVVRAIAGADTAVVHHVVQALGGVHGRADRADLFAHAATAARFHIGVVKPFRCDIEAGVWAL